MKWRTNMLWDFSVSQTCKIIKFLFSNWYPFTYNQLVKWDQTRLASAMGPAAVQLLAAGLESNADQAKRVEELFGKIWPPPNVWLWTSLHLFSLNKGLSMTTSFNCFFHFNIKSSRRDTFNWCELAPVTGKKIVINIWTSLLQLKKFFLF